MKKLLLLFVVLTGFLTSLSAQQKFPLQAEGSYSCTVLRNTWFSSNTFSTILIVTKDSLNARRFFTFDSNSVKTGTNTMDSVPNTFRYYYSTSNQWGHFSRTFRWGNFKLSTDSLILNTTYSSGPPHVSTSNYYKCKKVIPVSLVENKLEKLQLLPNPVRENLQVKYFYGLLNYSIYNGFGALSKSGQLTESNTQIEVIALPKGIYFIQFEQEGLQYTEKFVKE
jgi:hypothetical protein